jgi:hypothetical protein
MAEITPLPNGVLLHRWTNPTGDEWACAASDHGPMCRLCQPVDGTLAACLENVMDGLFEIVGVAPDGDFQFRVTDEGNRRVRNMINDIAGGTDAD